MTAIKPPADATHVCELRPRDVGTGFEIISRTRILSWRQDAAGYLLPVTAYGPMIAAAFVPHRTRPEDGFCFVECRATSGGRRWVTPIHISMRMTDSQVRGLLHETDVVREGTPTPHGQFRTSQVTQPPRSDPTPEEKHAMEMITRHYAAQATQPRSSTQQLRREIEALKKRWG